MRNDGADEADRSQQPPPLPVKLSQLRAHLGERSPRGSLDNLSISSDNTHLRTSPRSGFSSNVLLSPNLVNKLKKIPKKSKLNAPLPYVNLSKYDGDFDVNHVHLPAASTSAPDGGIPLCDLQRSRSRGYDNVRPERDSNKENNRLSMSLPGSRENLRNLSSPDLPVTPRVRNHSFSSEPIYANERCESPPPELPPKGPHLRNKQRQPITAASRPPAPPRLPERQRQTKSQYSSPSMQNVSNNSSQEDYFMMGNFEKEPTHCKIDFSEARRRNSSLTGRQVVNLPPRDQTSLTMTPSDCYMDMSGIMELDKPKSADAEAPKNTSRPRYGRSMSASGVCPNVNPGSVHRTSPRPESISVSAGNSPKEVRREMAIREENYMLMSKVTQKKPEKEILETLQEYMNASQLEASLLKIVNDDSGKKQASFDTEDRNDSSKCDEKVADSQRLSGTSNLDMPFDNLIDFNQPVDKVAKAKSVQSNSGATDKNDSGSAKTQGFFSRLMRRNSKDRKSVSQSHENLLSSSASEPVIKEDVSISESSSSGEDSRAQSQQDLVFGPKDRSRSSSFPNRSSYIAMNTESNSSSSTGISILSQQSDLGATNSSLNSTETVSTHASSNEGNVQEQVNSGETVISETDDGSKGNYEQQSYFFMGPLQNKEINSAVGDETERAEQGSSDQTSVCEMEEGDIERSSVKYPSDQSVDKVFTVLNVQGGNFDKNLCKTDDEKLIDLWHSTHSLDSDKSEKISELKSKMTLPLDEMSPDEKASAIARHISSLPPFVPPKMKSYPTKLSPVLEKSTPKGDKVEPLTIPKSSVTASAELGEPPVLSPSLMKLQAKATLRITPPSEDEHGKIWIPRTSQDISKGSTNKSFYL